MGLKHWQATTLDRRGFYVVCYAFYSHHNKPYLFKMLSLRHRSFQHRLFSFLLLLYPHKLFRTDSCASLWLGWRLNWEIHILILFIRVKPKSEKPPTSFHRCSDEKPRLFAGMFAGPKWMACLKLYGSIHHYQTEGGGAECTMWDSILSPPRLLFTPGTFSFSRCHAAAFLQSVSCCRVWPHQYAAHTGHLPVLRFQLHCREALKCFKHIKDALPLYKAYAGDFTVTVKDTKRRQSSPCGFCFRLPYRVNVQPKVEEKFEAEPTSEHIYMSHMYFITVKTHLGLHAPV